LSDNPEETEKKKASEASKQSEQQRAQDHTPPSQSAEQEQQTSQPGASRPVIGTPLGRPTVGTPISRPSIGTPIGKPVGTSPASKPVVGTPTTGSLPAGAAVPPAIGKPSIGTSAGAGVGRPAVGSLPTALGIATVPKKPVEPKEEVSRRNFLKGLAILGGIVGIAQFGLLGPYLQGTVKGSQASGSSEKIRDSNGNTIKSSDVALNNWQKFIWPYTGNPNLDNDTFSQFVVIHLPKNLTAPAGLSAEDPISKDTFIAFSRVCVHLWCLWSYVPDDQRMECPCHGSQYVPGTGSPWNQEPGTAVLGPASLQTPPNNQLPILQISIGSDGTISTSGTLVGQIGCGQKC
jgi:rieske iron-sulfur protein